VGKGEVAAEEGRVPAQQAIRQIKRIRMTECATVQPNQLFSYYPCGMPDSTNERWMELCSQAAQEQDAKKLLALTQEINRPLEEKQDRIQRTRLGD
jgi:hypothetical protein